MFLYATFVVASSVETDNNRLKKHFSLFSVVQFNNEECTTDTSPAGGTTEGTCYASSECSDKNGVSAGRCASGFGVCCVFINAVEANAQVMENRTRLRNAEFPAIDAATANQQIAWTINKMQSDICQIRLDFARFVIAGPSNTAEGNMAAGAATNCDQDTLTITTSDVPMVADTATGTLCGALTGEHLYVELSPTAADTATVTLNTNVATQNAAAADRLWDIKVSQIECFASYRAPQGCHRYLMADTGKITSLNFLMLANAGVGTGLELANQRIKTCIRRSKGMCCTEYHVCTSFNSIGLVDTNQGGGTAANPDNGAGSIGIANGNAQVINEAWSLDTNTSPFTIDGQNGALAGITVDGNAPANTFPANTPQINIGMVDHQCSGDYVEIPSSWSGSCGPSHGSARNAINSRYCGARFGANFQATPAAANLVAGTPASFSTPVCDCSEPFVVRHNSDTANDVGGTGSVGAASLVDANANTVIARHRGFCLDYKQIPCWN